MSRVALFLVVLSGVTVTATSTVEAKPKSSKKAGKKSKDNRTPTKSTKANMPRGFVWPANKHMTEMGEECMRSVEALGVTFEPGKAAGRVVTPMLPAAEINGVTFTPVYRKNQVWDCQLVLAVATFAPTLHELGVREVKYGSAFRWSKVRVSGRTKNILSRHALGIALDIVSFVDADGREAIVEKHYRRGDELLLGIEKAVNSSGTFRLLLTPKNDPKSHHDHFHLEANPDYAMPVTEKPAS
jgi:hypothetical protein